MLASLVPSSASTGANLCVAMCVHLVCAGCTTVLEREGRCLAGLTQEFIRAQEELRALEAAWVAAMYPEARQLRPRADQREGLALEQRAYHPDHQRGPTLGDPIGPPQAGMKSASAQHAYRMLVEARRHHAATVDWYGRVYERVQKRTEEERILSEARTILFPVGGFLIYPLIRWNARAVVWDQETPDGESDAIRRYCMERLATYEDQRGPTADGARTTTVRSRRPVPARNRTQGAVTD